MAALRFIIGALTVWVGALFCWHTRSRAARGVEGLGGFKAVLFTVQIWLLNAGTQYTTAGRSGVLINVYPFFLTLFSHFSCRVIGSRGQVRRTVFVFRRLFTLC